MRVKSELLKLSIKICNLDKSLFYWYNGNVLEGVICVYVDDFLWTGTAEFKNCVIEKLYSLFCIGNLAHNSFKYVGMHITAAKEGILVDQLQYVSSVNPIKISFQRASCKASELSTSEKQEYRALLGQLSWIATHTRPDIAFETCDLSVSHSRATVGDLLRLNKLVSRMKSDQLRMAFPKLKSVESCVLEAYADASFANLPDGSSQGGFVIFLKDQDNKRCPIFWQSRKIRRVVKSTLSAETLALLDCAEASVYLARILLEITGYNLKVNCVIDNKSLFDALHSSHCLEDRRLRIDIAVLRDMIDRGEITIVSWVASPLQLADCLTKKGVCTKRLPAAISRD